MASVSRVVRYLPLYDVVLVPGPIQFGPIDYHLVNFSMTSLAMDTIQGFLRGEIPL
jgi:hypothetical protein